MKTVTSVEAQNNFGRLMNTVPSEPVVITRHGRNYAMVIRYEDPVEFGTVSVDSLSDETRDSLEKARKLPKSAFVEF